MSNLVKPATDLIIVKENKILLARRANTGWMNGSLGAPGGHIEKGESPTKAIIREIQEELGIIIDQNDLEFLCIAARNTSPFAYASYEFVLRDKEYSFTNAEPDKCSELVWVDMYNLPTDIIEDFKIIIQEGLIGGKQFLELSY